MWESTVRVPDASTQFHTCSSSASRERTVPWLVARHTSRSNSVGVRWTSWPARRTRRPARSTTMSPKVSAVTPYSASTRRSARSMRRSSALMRATSSRIEKGFVM